MRFTSQYASVAYRSCHPWMIFTEARRRDVTVTNSESLLSIHFAPLITASMKTDPDIPHNKSPDKSLKSDERSLV